jgi:hypothetical protein
MKPVLDLIGEWESILVLYFCFLFYFLYLNMVHLYFLYFLPVNLSRNYSLNSLILSFELWFYAFRSIIFIYYIILGTLK